jgi:hypothetical protein
VFNNKLKSIPSELGQLTCLEKLYVRTAQNDRFSRSDASFGQLCNNPLPEIRGLSYGGPHDALQAAVECARRVKEIARVSTAAASSSSLSAYADSDDDE